MRTRVAINGMGRTGRAVLRGAFDRADRAFEIVAINDLAPAATIAHLLRHDSTFGRWSRGVEVGDGYLYIDDHALRVLHQPEHLPEPAQLPWEALGVDIVIETVVEATGRFCDRESAAGHLSAGASKVVLTAPAAGSGAGADVTVVMGINDDEYDATVHDIVSNASGTTQCLAPLAQVLHRAFGLVEGIVTVVRGYGAEQNLLDDAHSDLRRARSATVNVIPTSTGVGREVGEVLPELAGRLDGVALHVPVADASLVDLTARLAEPATVGQVNRAFTSAAERLLKGVLRCTSEPVVSTDVIGESASCLVDLGLTRVVGDTVQVFGWYDDEWGCGQRTLDLVDRIARTLPRR